MEIDATTPQRLEKYNTLLKIVLKMHGYEDNSNN